MRIFRHLLMVLAMLSVAALPGPSHAMSKHGDMRVAQQLHVRADSQETHPATEASRDGEERGCPDHDHGKCCVTGCCASTCLPLAEPAFLPAPRWTNVSMRLEGDDVARGSAVLGLPKRPPKTV